MLRSYKGSKFKYFISTRGTMLAGRAKNVLR